MILAIASFSFFGLGCFLLKFLVSMESLILAQDERWRRA